MSNTDLEAAEKEDTQTPRQVKDLWWKRISNEKAKHKNYRDLAAKATSAYQRGAGYNIFFPTVQTTQSALYSSTPNVEVRRRVRDSQGPQKDAAEVLQRAIEYCVDMSDFDGAITASINDLIVAGAGIARVIYEPEFTEEPNALTGAPEETIDHQTLRVEHVSWQLFGWQPGKPDWESVEWVYFCTRMAQSACESTYGQECSADAGDNGDRHIAIYEIIDRKSGTIIVLAEQFDDPLEIRRDELEFPVPEPMWCNLMSDKLIPASDFKYIATQCAALELVSRRMSVLISATKSLAFYDAHFTELAKLSGGTRDGQYFPVEDLLAKLGGTSLDTVIVNVPTANNGSIIELLLGAKDALKNEVYEILGIPDIMRGESNAAEGVQTQQLKSEFGAIRIRAKQGSVNRFVRDTFRIMGGIIGEHFEPPVLQAMTGIEITPDIMTVLRSDVLRSFSVDVETDSTNSGDKRRRQDAFNESLQTLISGVTSITGAMAQGTLPTELGQELLSLIVQSVDSGSTGNLNDVLSDMQAPQDQGDPQAMVAQLQQQLAQFEQQMQMMDAELQKRSQADMAQLEAKTQNLNADTAVKIASIPHQQAKTELAQIEGDGKRVEQVVNATANMRGERPQLVPLE